MSKKQKDCFDCEECEYVGEGGYGCFKYSQPEIVIEDFVPTEKFMFCKDKKEVSEE